MTKVTEEMVAAALEVHVVSNRENYVRRVLESALSTAPVEQVGVKTLLEQITSESDAAYCQSLRQFETTECLGWERKVSDGKFGIAEHNAHRKANELMGRHQGLARAASILRAHLSALTPENGAGTLPPVDHVAGATDAERLEDLRLAAKSIRTYMPETLPAGEDGKIHFARALAESAAEAIEAFLATTENKP